MPARYEFLTTWLLRAPRARVWEAIEDAGEWPRWWRGVVASELVANGDGDGVGRRYRARWRGAVPYTVEFEFEVQRIAAPELMSGRATGELDGTGTWRLFEHDGITAVTYDWRVSTSRAWMNAVAPVARPFFRWNHDWVMARGGEGLARRLGVDLVGYG